MKRNRRVGQIFIEVDGSGSHIETLKVQTGVRTEPLHDRSLHLLFVVKVVAAPRKYYDGKEKSAEPTQHAPIIAIDQSTSSTLRMKFFGILIAFSAGAIHASAVTIPAGTPLEVRLTSEVTSNKPSGDRVIGVIYAPVFVNGSEVMTPGAQLTGTTSDVNASRAATDQVKEQPATLRIHFTTIDDGRNHSQPIAVVLAGVDNARESINESGLITGITASQTYDARMDQGINKLGTKYEGFAQLLSGVKGAIFKPTDASIDYKPGVDLTVKLTKPLEWTGSVPPSVREVSPENELLKLANAEPSRTVAQSPPKPSDLTNLMFIGTKDQIKAAFQSAGWFPSAELSRSSKLETTRAIVENRGYSEAPMSVLFLEGNPPDLTFQKQNNTFAMRHHIRVWRRPDQFNGKPVWVAAATHDTGITFSDTSHNFTHGIDPNIDNERLKVTNDMLFTGKVQGIALVTRTGIGPGLSNATGDKLQTDGKIAVLEFYDK
jgi:hypothetical protein